MRSCLLCLTIGLNRTLSLYHRQPLQRAVVDPSLRASTQWQIPHAECVYVVAGAGFHQAAVPHSPFSVVAGQLISFEEVGCLEYSTSQPARQKENKACKSVLGNAGDTFSSGVHTILYLDSRIIQ